MAGEKKTYAAFTGVINKAITDFNSIYDAIKVRTGANDTDMKTDTTGIATSEYAGLINNKLFSIAGITDGGTKKGINPVINPYFDSYAGTPVAVNLGEDGNVAITVGIPYKGYYGTEARLTGSLAAENVALTGTIDGKSANITKIDATEGKGAHWHVAPTSGKVLGVVDVDIGSYAPSITEVTNAVSATASVGLSGHDGINDNISTTVLAGHEADYVRFTMKAAGSFSGNVTPVLGKTDFTAGYFEKAPALKIAETGYEIKGTATSTDQEFFIKKGTISNVKVAGTELDFFDDEGNIGTSVAPGDAEAAKYYKVTAGIKGGTITGNTTAGFVPDGTGTQIGNLNAISKDFYVKKGAVENSAVNVSLVAVSSDVKVESKDPDAYTVTVKRDGTEADKTTGNYSDGYVNKGTYTVSTTVAAKVLKIAKGAVKINNTLKGISYEGSGAGLLVKNDPENVNEYYVITPTVALTSAVNADGSKEGYIVPNDTTVTHNEFAGTASPLYLKKGKVTHTTDININNSSTDATAIFTTTKPTGVSYYTLTTKCNISANEGYITADDIAKGDEKSYYLPKAVVEYVADSKSGKNFVQVRSAGYLPSGTIETIAGNIDYAAVIVNIGTETGENIIKTSGTTGDYKLTIAKASATDAGYISGKDGEGTVGLATQYYIAKGSVDSQASIDSIVKSDIARATGAGASGFEFNVTASGSTGTPTIAAGYITASDVKLTKPTDKVVKMTLPEAQLAATLTGNVHAGAALTGLAAGDSTSKYYVTPTLENATVKATVGTAGYVDTASNSNPITIEINDTNRTVTYIKTGTTDKFTPTALDLSTKLSSDFNFTVSGDYTITLDGTDKFNGTLDTGYYGEAEKTIGVERGLTGSYTVTHGSVSVNSTAVTLGTATSSDVSLVTAPGKPADFAAITVPVSSVAISFNDVKPGYVKSTDVTNSTTATGSTTVYLKKYENSDDAPESSGSVPTASDDVNGGTTKIVYTPVSNGITDTTILHTEGRYLKHNVKVTLHADAIGSNAEADLKRLQERLAGQLNRD